MDTFRPVVFAENDDNIILRIQAFFELNFSGQDLDTMYIIIIMSIVAIVFVSGAQMLLILMLLIGFDFEKVSVILGAITNFISSIIDNFGTLVIGQM